MRAPLVSVQPVPIPEPTSEKMLRRAAARPLPEIGVTAQLLLICARETLTEAQSALLDELCGRIEDWDHLIQQARFRLIVALVHRHLSNRPTARVPERVIEELRSAARQAMIRNLAMTAVHHRLVREVMTPLGVPHVFFKGPSLAYRYYREPTLRQFRDIDLLLPRRHMVAVGQRLREAGFKSYPGPEWSTDDGLHFLQRFIGMMDWVSPEGMLVEMPSSLDGDWNRLPTDEIIDQAEKVAIGELDVAVIADSDFLCYLCKHHTRHHWARLHWISDLNAILSNPSFDLLAARARARQRGLERTVEAALAIQAAVAEPEPWKSSLDDPFAHELFRHCLTNLEGDFRRELALRAAFPATSIDIDPSSRRRRHWIHRNLDRFRPDSEDYYQCPLPRRWHWLYYVIRPLLWTTRKIRGWNKPSENRPTMDAGR